MPLINYLNLGLGLGLASAFDWPFTIFKETERGLFPKTILKAEKVQHYITLPAKISTILCFTRELRVVSVFQLKSIMSAAFG